MDKLQKKYQILLDRLNDADFRSNNGLGNEVGIHIFTYNPCLEIEMKEIISQITKSDSTHKDTCKYRIREFNLYDMVLDFLDEEEILTKDGSIDRLRRVEERRGQDRVLANIKRLASPDRVAQAIADNTFEKDDIIFLTGVGEAYPFIRLHNVLNNIQKYVTTPIVAFYPGDFTGATFDLFGQISDGNYYRAFELV